jgi:beta-galactosidase
MEKLGFDSTSFLIGNQREYLLSGEFHYFRVPKPDWHRRMKLFKEAGGNCLATYIPWLLHEPEEGVFLFAGEDHLDVEAFLEAAQAENLYVIVRPGPYQYSELMYDGLPGWLCENYPQLRAKNIRGHPFRTSSISYIHPLFLDKVKNWFEEVCPILAKYTISRGGPIAFTQIDNEMIGIHEWFGSLDYNPESMGFGLEEGRYPQYLLTKYGSIGNLNSAYGTSFHTFLEVPPPDPEEPSNLFSLRRKKDYTHFYFSTIVEYSKYLSNLIRGYGIDVPLMHNSANPGMNAYFLELVETFGSDLLLGSDHYYNLDQNWPQNNPTPQYAANVFISLEMLRLMGYPPSVLELPGGSASEWPPFTHHDAWAAYMVNLALGMKGSNYYIFTGGKNPPNAGSSVDIYDYQASIGAQGDLRPLYDIQKIFGQFIHQQSWLLSAHRPYDFRIAFDFEHPRSTLYWRGEDDLLFSGPEAWNLLRKGLISTAFCTGLSPSLVDLRSDDWVKDTRSPLVVISTENMALENQNRLVQFMLAGGRILLVPMIPRRDQDFQPATALLDFLGNPHMIQNTISQPRCMINNRFIGTTSGAGKGVLYSRLPQDAEIIGVESMTNSILAWKKTIPGGGMAVVMGMPWIHAYHAHEWMLINLLSELGLERHIRCSNPNVWTTLWVNGNQAMLFLINLFTSTMHTEVQVRLDTQSAWGELYKYQVDPISVKVIQLPIS